MQMEDVNAELKWV